MFAPMSPYFLLSLGRATAAGGRARFVASASTSSSPIVGVWDGVLSFAELATLKAAGMKRDHSFTAVFDRRSGPPRTAFEASLCSILEEVGDASRFLEYW